MKEPIYLKFNDYKTKVDWPWWIKLLMFLSGNYRTQMEIMRARYWMIEFEYDDESQDDFVNREIGFDENGNSIVAAPTKKNRGLWTDEDFDSAYIIEHLGATEISKDEFEKNWDDFIRNNPNKV